MPSEETIELIKLNSTVGKKTNLPSNSPRGTAISKLKELLIEAENIPLLSLLYGSGGTDQTLTLDTGENSIFAIVSDGTYLYCGTVTTPARVVRVDLATFTKYDTITLSTGEDQISRLTTDGTYLYVTCLGRYAPPASSGSIVRIHLQTFTRVDAINFSTIPGLTDNHAWATTFDGTYLYVGTDASFPGQIVKIDTRTFTFDSVLTFAAADSVRDMAIDGTFLYACTFDSPGRIVKANLATFLEVDSITLEAGVPNEDTETLFIHGEILYTSCYTTPVVLVKVDLSTFTRCHAITLSAGTLESQGIFVDGTYVYVASGSTPARVTIVDISRFEELTTTTLATGSNVGGRIFVDQTYMYMGLITSPGQIFRTFIFPTNNSSDRRIVHIDESCSNVSTYFLRPENSIGVALISGVGVFTKGAYANIIGLNTEAERFYLHAITLDKTTVNKNFEVDIAISTVAIGSETVIATVNHEVSSTNDLREYIFVPNIKIAANTRVAARCSDETGSNTVRAKLRIRQGMGG